MAAGCQQPVRRSFSNPKPPPPLRLHPHHLPTPLGPPPSPLYMQPPATPAPRVRRQAHPLPTNQSPVTEGRISTHTPSPPRRVDKNTTQPRYSATTRSTASMNDCASPVGVLTNQCACIRDIFVTYGIYLFPFIVFVELSPYVDSTFTLSN